MAGKNVYNNNDSMDINELAALNEADFSSEYLEQLQQQIIENSEATNFIDNPPTFDENNDATLFEEPQPENKTDKETTSEEKSLNSQENNLNNNDVEVEIVYDENVSDTLAENNEPADDNTTEKAHSEGKHSKKSANVQNFDDNFIKKYKAKLNKQKTDTKEEDTSLLERSKPGAEAGTDESPISELSNGNIVERELTQEQKDYNNSLDFLDGNVKYSKYVIYIDPQNVDFIESLTVKERKNLINRIIREQDDIKITKNKFRIIQAVINHVLIAIFTVAISIPILYYTLNASLEATIDNYRRSQTNFQVLYKNHGKISNKN